MAWGRKYFLYKNKYCNSDFYRGLKDDYKIITNLCDFYRGLKDDYKIITNLCVS